MMYLWQIPRYTSTLPKKVQGIVILTGDKDRLETGFSLLTPEAPQRRVFVSGVYPGVRLSDTPWKSRSQRYKITLGYAAHNTRENALESALWINRNGFKTVALVTSDYHMPRSLAEFRRIVPWVQIYPVPVVHERDAIWYWHMVRESVEMLFSTLWTLLDKL